MCILFVYMLKVASYYDLSVLSVSKQKKFGWGVGGWVGGCVGGVSSIQVYFFIFLFFLFCKAPK